MRKLLQKIFKNISYSVFLKIHGKIEGIIQADNDNRIKINTIDVEKILKYKVYKIIDGRLYTDRIHDTAVILDKKIIEGPSFQHRYFKDSQMYNSQANDNIVFEKGTPRKIKKLNGITLSLLTGGGGNESYWHWLFDVLPRLFLCSKTIKLNDVDFFLLPNLSKKFQIETLNYLNIPQSKRLSSEKFRHITTKDLIVTDHPVVVSGNASVDNNNQPAWIAKWLRDSFIKPNIVTEKQGENKIYIDRSIETNKKPQRTIANEDDVKKELVKNNFTPVKLHNISFKEQVNLFYNAKCVVGLHGAGFANLVFCKPGTKVVELRSPTSGDSIKNISKKNNLNYDPIIVDSKQIYKIDFPNQQGSHQIPIKELIKKIES